MIFEIFSLIIKALMSNFNLLLLLDELKEFELGGNGTQTQRSVKMCARNWSADAFLLTGIPVFPFKIIR